MPHIAREVEKFLRRSNMPPTRFGRLAVNDPAFVSDLRQGREPRARVSQRVLDFIDSQEASND